MSLLMQTEAARWQDLRPYLVSNPRRGVIGNSRYAKRLRSQILAAAKSDTRSVYSIATSKSSPGVSHLKAQAMQPPHGHHVCLAHCSSRITVAQKSYNACQPVQGLF